MLANNRLGPPWSWLSYWKHCGGHIQGRFQANSQFKPAPRLWCPSTSGRFFPCIVAQNVWLAIWQLLYRESAVGFVFSCRSQSSNPATSRENRYHSFASAASSRISSIRTFRMSQDECTLAPATSWFPARRLPMLSMNGRSPPHRFQISKPLAMLVINLC